MANNLHITTHPFCSVHQARNIHLNQGLRVLIRQNHASPGDDPGDSRKNDAVTSIDRSAVPGRRGRDADLRNKNVEFIKKRTKM
jgi:hypothetical protein